jgi:hypothetical protein
MSDVCGRPLSCTTDGGTGFAATCHARGAHTSATQTVRLLRVFCTAPSAGAGGQTDRVQQQESAGQCGSARRIGRPTDSRPSRARPSQHDADAGVSESVAGRMQDNSRHRATNSVIEFIVIPISIYHPYWEEEASTSRKALTMVWNASVEPVTREGVWPSKLNSLSPFQVG